MAANTTGPCCAWKIADLPMESIGIYSNHGRIFPFGIRGYLLERAHLGSPRRGLRKAIVGALAGATGILFNALLAIPIVALCTIAVTASFPGDSAAIRWLSLAVATELILFPITNVVEMIVSYATLGSYGGAFHRPKQYLSVWRRRQLLVEVQVLAFNVGMALIGGTTLYFVLARQWSAFSSLGALESAWNGIADSAYYALMSLLTADNPNPTTLMGRGATALVTVEGVGLLVVVLASLTSLTALVPSEASAIQGAPIQRTSGEDREQRAGS
jgi:hypothetical protein